MAGLKLRLDHIAFPVFDVEATYTFYSEVLGLPLVASHSGDDWGGREWLMMIFCLSDDRQLALVAFKGAKKPAIRGLPSDSAHFALSVENGREFQAWQKKLKSAGIAFAEEDHGTQRSIYFSDPNGYTVEITTPASSRATNSDIDAARGVRGWIGPRKVKASRAG